MSAESWPHYRVYGKYDVKPPTPPHAWAKMHHNDIGLPTDPPLGVQPDSGEWLIPLLFSFALGCGVLIAVSGS